MWRRARFYFQIVFPGLSVISGRKEPILYTLWHTPFSWGGGRMYPPPTHPPFPPFLSTILPQTATTLAPTSWSMGGGSPPLALAGVSISIPDGGRAAFGNSAKGSGGLRLREKRGRWVGGSGGGGPFLMEPGEQDGRM